MGEQLKVGLHLFGFVGSARQQAADDFYPGWAQMFAKINGISAASTGCPCR